MQCPAQLVDAYRATLYQVRLPSGTRVTLRIGKPVPEVVSSWAGRSWPLVYISACNPHSKALAVTENRNRLRAMIAKLDQPGIRRLLGAGRNSDQSWRETSFLIAGLSLQAADRLALEFGQNAVVIATDPKSTRLRVYRNEWRGRFDNEAHIMWTGR